MVKIEFNLSEDLVKSMESFKAKEGKADLSFNEYAKFITEESLNARHRYYSNRNQGVKNPDPADIEDLQTAIGEIDLSALDPDESMKKLKAAIGKIDLSALESDIAFMTPDEEERFWNETESESEASPGANASADAD